MSTIVELLPGKPENAMTTSDVVDKLGEQGIKRTVAMKALSDLTEAGTVRRTGEGKRGSPYRYYKGGEEEAEKDSSDYKGGVADERKQEPTPIGEKHSSETPVGSERKSLVPRVARSVSFATPTYTRTKETDEEVKCF